MLSYRTLLGAAVFLFFFSCQKTEAVNLFSGDTMPGPPDTTVSGTQAPNIIFILGDDIGYEVPTCDGGQSYSTPNIDQMAANGMIFNQCHAAPLCSPSRFMLLTGKYNFRNYSVWGSMPQNQKTIANMLHDQGYATCVAGKWQLDGGDASIHDFGFDNYAVWDPFNVPDAAAGSRYKDPVIYENGANLPASTLINQYGEDYFSNYVMNFMSSASSQHKSFFVYYPMVLSHEPFSPTPNDPAFATWNPSTSVNASEPSYFPEMVNYMDYTIGKIITKVKNLGISNNTIIIYSGDNGTPTAIFSQFKGMQVQGAKGSTIEYGTHVPLIIDWPGTISPSSVNNDLISFVDFMPSLAGMVKIPEPTTYGPLDGVDFSPRLTGLAGNPRSWIFLHYQPNFNGDDQLKRFVQDTTYKLYDATNHFYNIITDIFEKSPIDSTTFTPLEQTDATEFRSIISTMHN